MLVEHSIVGLFEKSPTDRRDVEFKTEAVRRIPSPQLWSVSTNSWIKISRHRMRASIERIGGYTHLEFG